MTSPPDTAIRGGKRPGAGRRKGARSEYKLVASELAKQYAQAALEALNEIMTGGESESARVAAANAILDRAYGKPAQAVAFQGDEKKPVKMEISWLNPAEAYHRLLNGESNE